MVNAFRKSRITAYIIGPAAALLAALVTYFALQQRSMGPGARIAASLLAAAAAAYFVCYIAKVQAVREYQELLLLLYRDLEPEKLITALEGILTKRLSAEDRAMALIHLSNAYLYKGDAAKALEILESITPPESATEVRGLLAGNKGACQLRLGKPDKAAGECTALIALSMEKKTKALQKDKLSHAAAYLRLCIRISEQKNVDISVLEKDFESTRAPLHKLDAEYNLFCYYRSHGQKEKEEEARKYLLENQKGTCFIA